MNLSHSFVFRSQFTRYSPLRASLSSRCRIRKSLLERIASLHFRVLAKAIRAAEKLYPGHEAEGHPDIDPGLQTTIVSGRYRILNEDDNIRSLCYAHPEDQSAHYAHIDWPFGFNKLPEGDWNFRYISRPSSDAKQLVISSTEHRDLKLYEIPHPLDFPRQEITYSLAMNKCRILGTAKLQAHGWLNTLQFTANSGVTEFDPGQAVILVDTWPFQKPASGKETKLGRSAQVYAAVQGNNIAPRILAYIRENQRTQVIDMAIESLEARLPGPADMDECRNVLGRLHSHEIVYGTGDLSPLSFLVVEGEGGRKRVLMQGFTESIFADDEAQKRAELAC